MLYKLLDFRKRRDRWWRFLVLKEAFVRAEGGPGISSSQNSCLRGAFKRFGYPVPSELSDFWELLVQKGAANCPVLKDNDLLEAQAGAAALDAGLLPYLCWLDLFRLCIGLGFFETARILREKALDRIVEDAAEPRASLDEVTLACYARIERDMAPEAMALLGRMEALQCPRQRCDQVRWYLNLMTGTSSDVDGAKVWGSPRDAAFAEAIAGKRVALAGPVATDSAHGGDIDSHDVVVKFGYRGGAHGCVRDTQGERVDIAYYNNTQAKALSKSDYQSVFARLRWGVCHNRKGTSWFPDSVPNLRLLTSFQWFLPDTHLNAGPNAVIDMLRFRPAEIRVFNTDMMLSSGRFAGYRQPGDKPTDYTRSFIKTHDPVLQYLIMRRLWVRGHLAGDERFDEVMSMGLSRYLEQLQQAYGADTRALF